MKAHERLAAILNNREQFGTDFGGDNPSYSTRTIGIDDWGDLQDTAPAVRNFMSALYELLCELHEEDL